VPSKTTEATGRNAASRAHREGHRALSAGDIAASESEFEEAAAHPPGHEIDERY